jgi:hypothetical protein
MFEEKEKKHHKANATAPATAQASTLITPFAFAPPVMMNVGVLLGDTPVPFAKLPFGFTIGVGVAEEATRGLDHAGPRLGEAGGATGTWVEEAPDGQEV